MSCRRRCRARIAGGEHRKLFTGEPSALGEKAAGLFFDGGTSQAGLEAEPFGDLVIEIADEKGSQALAYRCYQ